MTRVLLLGEGDFSFAASLGRLGRDDQTYALATQIDDSIELFATSFDPVHELTRQYPGIQQTLKSLRNSAEIRHNVNACLTDLLSAELGGRPFDLILWNHPHLGKEDAQQHRRLIAHFIHNAVKALSETGRIVIRLLDGQFERWGVEKTISRLGLYHRKFPFTPHYSVKRNRCAKSFTSTEVKKNWVPGHHSPTSSMTSFTIVVTKAPLPDVDPLSSHTLPEVTPDTFLCEACSPPKRFPTAQGLRTHHRQVHTLTVLAEEQPVSCASCSRHFRSADALRQHLLANTCSSKRPRLTISDHSLPGGCEHCPVCDEVFASLAEHQASFAPLEDTANVCSKCSRRFKDSRALEQHSRTCLTPP